MADKYLANARLKIGGTTYEPGDDITSVLPSVPTIHAWIAANKITKVRTTVVQATGNKQKIPTGSDRVQAGVYSTPRTQPNETFRRGTDV